MRQDCEAGEINILQGSVGIGHILLLLSCPISIASSKVMQYLKGRSFRLLQDEFSEFKKRYWIGRVGGYFYATTENVTQEIIRNYIANQSTKEKEEISKMEE